MQEHFERPKIILLETKNDKVVNIISICLLVFLWAFSIWLYINAPEKVPMHFNGSGNVDGYGSKISILLLPLIGTLAFLLLQFLSSKPHIFNYPFTITKVNYEMAYKNAVGMLKIQKVLLLILFSAIQFMTYTSINKTDNKFGYKLLIIALVFMLATPIFFISKSIKNK